MGLKRPGGLNTRKLGEQKKEVIRMFVFWGVGGREGEEPEKDRESYIAH